MGPRASRTHHKSASLITHSIVSKKVLLTLYIKYLEFIQHFYSCFRKIFSFFILFNGGYSFRFSPDSLPLAASVRGQVFALAPVGKDVASGKPFLEWVGVADLDSQVEKVKEDQRSGIYIYEHTCKLTLFCSTNYPCGYFVAGCDESRLLVVRVDQSHHSFIIYLQNRLLRSLQINHLSY